MKFSNVKISYAEFAIFDPFIPQISYAEYSYR